eukprot:TRINITY_DN1709_c0_g1_i1.p1 TRINITY_DN1709_c0_g1~~TRINITY_DN1709_c0_g1_i1.p1  ORF type:complete len:278 (+),score=58.85 TRINITY_DN1709_c0_g1_i1:118-951(+)
MSSRSFLLFLLLTVLALVNCQGTNNDNMGSDIIGKVPVPDEVKSHDPALDDALGKLVVKVALDGQVNVKTEKPFTQTTLDTRFYSWKVCVRLPILNVTCVEPYLSVNDLTMGVRLTSDGQVLLQKSSPGTAECVNDAKLLGLVTLTPALLPFKPLLDRVIRLTGLLPAQVMSACVKLQQFQVTKTNFSGCVVFDANIMCWRGKCVYKTTKPLGCFNLPFSQQGGKLVVKAGALKKRRNLGHLNIQNNLLHRAPHTHTNTNTNKKVRSHRKKRVLRRR